MTELLTGWKRRKTKQILSSSYGILYDYQMLTIRILKSNGVDSNGGQNDVLQYIYTGSNVKDDFSDVRFTDINNNLLSHYMSKLSIGNYADFTIKIPTITSNQYIYIYYDNPYALPTDNGTNTFLFFDDFSSYLPGEINNQGGWITRAIGGSTGFAKFIQYNNKTHLVIYADNNINADQTVVMHPTLQSNNTKLSVNLVYPLIHYNTEGGIIGFSTYEIGARQRPINGYQVYYFAEDNTQWKLVKWTNGIATVYSIGSDVGESNTYYEYELSWFNNTIKGYKNKNELASVVDSTFNSFPYITLNCYGNPVTDPIYIDEVTLRKYVEPEPSWGITYPEEVCETPLVSIELT